MSQHYLINTDCPCRVTASIQCTVTPRYDLPYADQQSVVVAMYAWSLSSETSFSFIVAASSTRRARSELRHNTWQLGCSVLPLCFTPLPLVLLQGFPFWHEDLKLLHSMVKSPMLCVVPQATPQSSATLYEWCHDFPTSESVFMWDFIKRLGEINRNYIDTVSGINITCNFVQKWKQIG